MSNYTFKDASGSTQTAAAASVAGALYPQIQIVDNSQNAAVISSSGEQKITGSVQGTMTIAGSVATFQGGAWTTSVVGGVSILGGSVSITPASVSGVGIFNINHTGNGSVLTLSQGSVITVLQAPSIVGTYAEDTAHATGDKGLFALGVRNDTMSSITSADGDYSPMATGPVGEMIVANSPITKWVSAQTSVMYGTSVQAVAPQGSSVFTYITSAQIANNSGTFSLVKFTGGLGSVLGWTVAPANGGSNIIFVNPLRTGENSGFSVSISGVSSVYLSAQGFISKL